MAVSSVLPTSENGPKDAAPCTASRSDVDQCAEILRLRTATNAMVNTGIKPGSPGPVLFEMSPCEYPGKYHSRSMRSVSGVQGLSSVTMQWSKLMEMLLVATGCGWALAFTAVIWAMEAWSTGETRMTG